MNEIFGLSNLSNISNHDKVYKFIQGKIYTGIKFVSSLIIQENKIIFSGDLEDSQLFIQKNNISEDKISHIILKSNQLVLPGFIDSHVHPLLGGLMELNSLKIYDCKTAEEIFESVKNFINENPDRKIIFTGGYFDSQLPSKITPLQFIDQITPIINKEVPIVIMRFDAHAYWCNSAMINQAGITKDTVTPEGGYIEKDENGELNGVFHDAAMGLLKKAFPKISFEERLKVLQKTFQMFNSFGITSFMDAAVTLENYKVYDFLYKNSNEKIEQILPRCSLSISGKDLFIGIDPPESENNNSINASLVKLEQFFQKFRVKDWDSLNDKNKFRVNAVKLFIDGVFESGTALVNKCKCGNGNINQIDVNTETSGSSKTQHYTYSQEELQLIINFLYKNDLQIHCHCIGDLASSLVIDAIEKAKNNFSQKNNFTNDNSYYNYLAHLQLFCSEDIKRMKLLNIAGNMTPFWFQKTDFDDQLLRLIGNDRIREIYPIRKLIDEGVHIGFGSDWCVSTLNPLEGIEIAVTHRSLAESDDKPSYNSDNVISLTEAVRAYTLGSAEILGMDKFCGTLEVGKLADFIVLDKNIFDLQPWLIHTAQVEMTFIDGTFVYKR